MAKHEPGIRPSPARSTASRRRPRGRGRSARRVAAALLGAALLAALAACGSSGPNGTPTAPRGVAAIAIPGGVRVTWVDQSSDEEGFVVLRMDANEEGPPSREVGRSGAGEQAFDDFSTEPDGSYLYAVAAYNVVGESAPVLQEPAEPVSPQPGVGVSVAFDGEGLVVVSGGAVTRTCSSDCQVAFAAGTVVTLTAESREGAVFAGWAGACEGAGSCELKVDQPREVQARFRRHVLQLSLDGDSPVRLEVNPQDDFDNNSCQLAAGESCAFAYGYTVPFVVSVYAYKVDAAAKFLGYEGDCSTEQGIYCVANVSGATPIAVQVVRPPVAAPDAYEVDEDEALEVGTAAGVLSNDSDSADDALSAVLESGPTHGELDLSADGSFRYVPDPDYNGSDSFTYRARDAYGNESAVASVSVSVRPVNDPPVFSLAGDPAPVKGNGVQASVPNFATGIGSGGGADEATQSISGFAIAKVEGNIDDMNPTIGPDGTLSFKPPFGSSGSATYEVTLSDGGGTANGGQDTSTAQRFTITVEPILPLNQEEPG